MSDRKARRNTRTFIAVVTYTGYAPISGRSKPSRKETRQPGARVRRLRVGARDARQAKEAIDAFLGSDGHSVSSIWEVTNPDGLETGRDGRKVPSPSLPRGVVIDDIPFARLLDDPLPEARMRDEDERSRRALEARRQEQARRRTLERKRERRERRARARQRREGRGGSGSTPTVDS